VSTFIIGERHIAGDSFVHRLDPRAKLIATLAFILAAVVTPQARWEVFGAMAVVLAVAVALSGLSPLLLLRRALLALPFVLAAVPVLFNRAGGSELFEVPLAGWSATTEGLEALTSILLRSWLSVLAATLLTATTEADHILRSLRAIGVPYILVSTMSFMWRYVFVIGEEAQRMLRARESRSVKLGKGAGGSIGWRAAVAGHMVGSLFLRTLNRSERIYVAMQSRGYNGELRSLQQFTFRTIDLAAVGAIVAAVVTIQAYAHV
jgi:cobalt/nickel transport system permease protein